MKAKGLEEYIRFVKDRAYNLSVRKGYKVFISVVFIKDSQSNQVLENKNRKVLSNLVDIVSYQNPDSIKVLINANGQSQAYTYDLNYSNNNTDSRHFSSNDENNRQMTKSNENNEMAGLGNMSPVNIESIVNKRLDEERKERELTELKTKINENDESLNQKNQEIGKLTSEVESQQQEIEALQKTIATKSNFKYYAGITGDILQSFGINKEIIATPLAGILTGDNDNEPKAIEEKITNDDSGIIDDEQPKTQAPKTSVSNKRAEMIALISEYLQGIDNKTLSNVFTIFSEIENDPNNSELILEFLKSKK